MKKLNKKGFTIVELVIVIAVIAILAAVLIPTFSGVVEKANKSAAMQAARNEYELYLAEYAETLKGTEDYVIESGNYYFAVKDGQFNKEAMTKEDATSAAGIATLDASKDLSEYDVYTKDLNPKDAGDGVYVLKDGSYVLKTNESSTVPTYTKTVKELGNVEVKIYKAQQ